MKNIVTRLCVWALILWSISAQNDVSSDDSEEESTSVFGADPEIAMIIVFSILGACCLLFVLVIISGEMRYRFYRHSKNEANTQLTLNQRVLSNSVMITVNDNHETPNGKTQTMGML